MPKWSKLHNSHQTSILGGPPGDPYGGVTLGIPLGDPLGVPGDPLGTLETHQSSVSRF